MTFLLTLCHRTWCPWEIACNQLPNKDFPVLIIPFLHICDNPLNVYKYIFFRQRSNVTVLDSRITLETPGMSCPHPPSAGFSDNQEDLMQICWSDSAVWWCKIWMAKFDFTRRLFSVCPQHNKHTVSPTFLKQWLLSTTERAAYSAQGHFGFFSTWCGNMLSL